MVTGKEAGKFLVITNSKCSISFWKDKKMGSFVSHEPYSHPWNGPGAHQLRVSWTSLLPANIFMTLFSENGTPVSDFSSLHFS